MSHLLWLVLYLNMYSFVRCGCSSVISSFYSFSSRLHLSICLLCSSLSRSPIFIQLLSHLSNLFVRVFYLSLCCFSPLWLCVFIVTFILNDVASSHSSRMMLHWIMTHRLGIGSGIIWLRNSNIFLRLMSQHVGMSK